MDSQLRAYLDRRFGDLIRHFDRLVQDMDAREIERLRRDVVHLERRLEHMREQVASLSMQVRRGASESPVAGRSAAGIVPFSLGQGRSGRGDLAERSEELLARDRFQ